MSVVDKSVVSMLSALLFAIPATHAGDRAHRECIIDAVKWGSIDGLPQTNTGLQSRDGFFVLSDAGDLDVAFVVFELPRFNGQVIFGKLRLQIDSAFNLEVEQPSEFQLLMYDVADKPLLLQPFWTIEEFFTVLSDLKSGREYGEFTVRTSPTDDGRVLEVPLSYDAMFDINEARGDSIAIGIATGDGWGGEAESVKFLSPTDGGVVQLVLPNCRSHQRR